MLLLAGCGPAGPPQFRVNLEGYDAEPVSQRKVSTAAADAMNVRFISRYSEKCCLEPRSPHSRRAGTRLIPRRGLSGPLAETANGNLESSFLIAPRLETGTGRSRPRRELADAASHVE